MIKFCKEHGDQKLNYIFCPYCGSKLKKEKNKEEEIVCKKKYILTKIRHSNNSVENLAFKEAIASAWMEIGICSSMSHMLAKSGKSPEEIQNLLKDYFIEGIGAKSSAVINNFDSSDFEQFNQTCKELKTKGTWCWNLAEWFYGLPDGCNNGQYIAKKIYFKKNQSKI